MSQKYLCLGEFLKIKYLVQKILILADPEDYFSGLIDMKNSYLLDIIKEVRDKIKPEYFQKKIINGNLAAIKKIFDIFEQSGDIKTQILQNRLKIDIVQCLTELFVVNQMDKIHFICGYIPAKKVFDIFGRVYIHYIKKYGKIFNEFDMSGGKGKVELKMKAMEENISFEYIFKD